ncbi:envelope biogenesis factor ElyC [Vibrio sp. SM6]|uniref:Envelope biogenesis factor ElyC n=1 Tax=Vibrio agarilyticus TaxID=2726741 RepID=A0A7X8TMR3_9VIBR|nr:envelope biogenesis factor ElyC [Vibrio agarilyticus]NLS11297.1 envelope biogenesis factor ElyC [Vibrio agarilyticus]
MFELKKVVSALLMPLPGFLLIGLFGLILIMFTTKRKSGCIIILFSFIGLFLVSFHPVSSRLLLPIERQYTAFLPVEEKIDYVMVLGNSHIVDDELPPTSELSRAALMRLAEGIRILRIYPGAKLILSGYGGGTEISHARMMANVALALGVAKSDIVLLEDATDTWEEARHAAAFVREANLVLVTSASHMPRAMIDFNLAGLNPYPAPTNYLTQREISQPWSAYAPKAIYLEQTERFWHETLGRIWQKLRDKVSTQSLEAAPSPTLVNDDQKSMMAENIAP